MCGITGFFNIPSLENKEELINLSEIISNRGPDEKKFVNVNNLFLIFTRLSIIDLSNNAMQPMKSNSGKSIIVFNGEIYNFLDIKQKLLKLNIIEKDCFSDTRILLESLEYFGIDILSEFRGMFSIFYFNTDNNDAFLINDRFGEKPLYFSITNKNFFFSSDIRSFNFEKRKLNKSGIKSFFANNCFSYPDTIWENVNRISPGSYIKFKVNFENNTVTNPKSYNYWEPNSYHIISKDSLEEATNKLDFILCDVIEKQINADVEVGSFLSGGVDSSLITSIAQKVSNNKLSTFSIGFENHEFDESVYAEKIANYLKTNHKTKICTKNDINKIFETVIDIYGEPYSDSSQLPTILLSSFASESLKVVLTGDGGDELFGGYERYSFVSNVWKYINFFPPFLRNKLKVLFELSSPYSYSFFSFLLKSFIPKYKKTNYFSSKFRNLIISLDAKNPVELAERISSHFGRDFELLKNHKTNFSDHKFFLNKNKSIAENIMLYDMRNYLPNDLLVKTDRASMRFGLEARMPFLDHHLYEFSNTLPIDFKIHKNKSKIILKKLLSRYLPTNLYERPKQGFLVPLNEVLNDQMVKIQTILNSELIKEQGILNHKIVEKELSEFKSGNSFNQYNLWDIINFQMWINKNIDNIAF